MTTFYAQPYSFDHQGFYFNSLEKYEENMKHLAKLGCEEFEIQFIDGDDAQCRIAKASNLSQCNIELWFEELENFNEQEAEQLNFLLDCGYTISDALNRYEEVITISDIEDHVYDLISGSFDINCWVSKFIDTKAIILELQLEGQIVEIAETNDKLWVINANDF